MKPLNKRVAGSVTILAALALTAIAYFPLINDQNRTAKQLTPMIEMPPANNNSSAIAIQGDDVIIVRNDQVLKLDRNSLAVKQSQDISAHIPTSIKPVARAEAASIDAIE
jgi:hypothetical protein